MFESGFVTLRAGNTYSPPAERAVARSRISRHRGDRGTRCLTCAFYLFIRQPHGAEVSPAARNTLDSARIPRASKLLICGLFQKGRVLAQDDQRFVI